MDQNDTPLAEGTEHEDNRNENTEPINNMEALLETEGLGIDFPHQGEIREGMVASITPGQILVSVGTKSEGVISGREYEAISAEELAALKIGQVIPVYVINPEDSSGTLVLSLTRARDEVNWQEVEGSLASKNTIDTKILGYNKGGLIALVNEIRGFIPASQIALGRRAGMTGDTPEQRYSGMVGDDISVVVIEVDRERRRLILSERAASTETRESVKDRLIEELNVGDIRTGRVTSLADFGAFVNINGADGLVHLSEISWDRIAHPSEVLKVGQEVKVKVIAVDRDKRRIGLSIRQLLEDPWSDRIAQIKVGQLVEATITRLAKFGAFARLADLEEVEGLIHISEISEKRIDHPREALHEGDTMTLRVIRIEPDNHRIALSVRRVDSMQYADMDWQTLLDQQAESEAKAEDAEESSEVAEAEAPTAEEAVDETVAELPETAIAEETPEVSTQPDAPAEEKTEEAPVDTPEDADDSSPAPEEPAA